MGKTCVHSCKDLCNALEVAEHREKEAIAEYERFAASCDYPDVRQILEDLIHDRKRALATLRDKHQALQVRFNVIDNINESFL